MRSFPLFGRRLSRTVLLAGALVAATAGAASAQEPGPLRVEAPWSRATPPGARTGAGYLVIRNDGERADRLVSVTSPRVPAVEIHQMRIDDGVMTMRALDEGLEIPANGTAELSPGGLHLMLVGLDKPLAEGERVPLTLRFEEAGTLDVELVVEAMRARGPSPAAGAHVGHGAPHGHADQEGHAGHTGH